MSNETAPMRTILVGVDGSPGAARALQWAATRSLEADADVVAVHVLTYDRELVRDLALDTITTWRRTLHHQLDHEWTEPARAAGTAVRTVLVEDDGVAGGLLRVAAEVHADLVVLGAHGRGTIIDRLLGATTYAVSHRAHTPVVIVPVDWQPLAA